ncbi:MAG TPA: response regulator [Anaerolineae bacterium]|nr:response regulator [Anaerolineae bacterium]
MKAEISAHILVVDDTPRNLELLIKLLSSDVYKIRPANSGKVALLSAKANPPDLILLDIMMPNMDGYEVCRQLKLDPTTKDIPILFISALDEAFDKVKAFEAGGVDYIVKPFQAEEVVARIETHLSLHRLRQELVVKNEEVARLNGRLQQFLRQFTAKEVADKMVVEGVQLGGERVEITALFIDIRSFTTITEAQSPELTVALLNDYYAYTIKIIEEIGGIVNQIWGDGIMCVFGAPVKHDAHGKLAVEAAIAVWEQIKLFNCSQVEKGRLEIKVGMGIATGVAIVGYIGTETRATYTCVGDAVNLAARLQEMTKLVGKPILMNEATWLALEGEIPTIDEGVVAIRGKEESVRAYSVWVT